MVDTPPSDARRKRLYLIDGSAYIFRAYHALPPMSAPDRTPVNAVYGFTTMLLKLIEDALADADADYMAVIMDTAGGSFRNEIYTDYKANRPPAPEDLVPQFPLVRQAAAALGLPCIEQEGFEADDLIATYARLARDGGARVTIVSSDKDLMQLVNDDVEMLDPMKNRRITGVEVAEKFGVGPDRVIDVQALAGDSTDNVPGVPGIGVKTAAQLIGDYGDLDNLLARAEEIKQPKRRQNLIEFAEQARLSRRLVTLKQDVPLTSDTFDQFALKAPTPEEFAPFLRAMGFKSLLSRFDDGQSNDSGPSALAATNPKETHYSLVQDADTLRQWVDRARARGLVAFDTETDSLDAMQARLVGVSLSIEPGEACYIPLAHRAPAAQGALDLGDQDSTTDEGSDQPRQIPMASALAMLKELLEDPATLKVGHNIKYDMQVMAQQGIAVAPIDDTMVLSYVLEAGRHGHGLDNLAKLHFDHTNIKFSEVAGSGRNQVTFDCVPLEAARDYAAEDADITLRLYHLLKPQLVSNRMTTVYETLERPLIPVLTMMEANGIAVDRTVLSNLSKDFASRMAHLEAEIHALADETFNIASPKQLGDILFAKMGLEGGKKTKTGAYGTDAAVLEKLAAQGHDLPARVLDWRQLAKLKSTYTDALIEQINPKTGRVHTSYGMTIASTGRLSSTDPNLQNIPVRTEEGRKIRGAFIPADGCKLVSLDYSQIELRLLAHVAQMDVLRDAFRDGQDIHAMTASQVFDVPLADMDPMVRRRAKAINFGIIYGISAFGLANQLGIERGEAARYIEAYFERYPGIRDYMESMKAVAREKGYVETPFGRRIHFNGINSKNPNERGFSERAAINAPLQGGAADIIKRAMYRAPAALQAAGLEARMLLQVHDELLFDVPEDQIDATIDVMRRVMEGAAAPAVSLSVPLVVDAGIGDSWAEAH